MSFRRFDVNTRYNNQLIKYSKSNGNSFTAITFPAGVCSCENFDDFIIIIEVWNCRPLLMFAYSIGKHQQGSSVKEINFLRLICLEVTNSHINWSIPCTSTRFRFNKELNYKLAALEVFLPNRNAFASVVASLKIYCTSRRVILRTSCGGIFHCIFCLLVFIKH